MVDACGLELGRSRSDLIWLDLIDACGSEPGRSMLDRVLLDQSFGSVLVKEMVWIRPRGRVDVFRNGYLDGHGEIATNQGKWVERERRRERVYVKGVVERNKKKLRKLII